jgi:transposase
MACYVGKQVCYVLNTATHLPSPPSNHPLCIESPIMAPHLSRSTHTLINTMMQHGFTNKDIATAAQCSSRAIQRIRLSQTSPNMPGQSTTRVGRPSRISPAMQKALQNRLDVRPDMYRCDIVNFLERKFGEKVSERAVGRALKSMVWTRKINRRIAKQRDPDLRDWYLYQIADFKSYHFVFVDESGCDGRVGYRRWGWSPKGRSPEIVTRFTRGKRWHILPAYTQDGILHSRVYRGKTDSRLFEDFIEQLLHFCGRYPEPRSVLVTDNASWHKSQKIRRMCEEAGVRVVFLPPYSPDFNPIEEYFGVLKRFIKKHWYENEELIKLDFQMFLEWCVRVVGDDYWIAQGHFRHAGISITKPAK